MGTSLCAYESNHECRISDQSGSGTHFKNPNMNL